MSIYEARSQVNAASPSMVDCGRRTTTMIGSLLHPRIMFRATICVWRPPEARAQHA
jgi:hypothetical protein